MLVDFIGRWGVVSFTVFSLGGCYWEMKMKDERREFEKKRGI